MPTLSDFTQVLSCSLPSQLQANDNFTGSKWRENLILPAQNRENLSMTCHEVSFEVSQDWQPSLPLTLAGTQGR